MIDADDPERRVRRSYWEPAVADGVVPRTIGALFTALGPGQLPRRHGARAPAHRAAGRAARAWHDHMRYVPATLIIRARKQGI